MLTMRSFRESRRATLPYTVHPATLLSNVRESHDYWWAKRLREDADRLLVSILKVFILKLSSSSSKTESK